MEYGNHRKHSAGARNVKARAKRALLLPSYIRSTLRFKWVQSGLRKSSRISFYIYEFGDTRP